jgi:hypothetical protein
MDLSISSLAKSLHTNLVKHSKAADKEAEAREGEAAFFDLATIVATAYVAAKALTLLQGSFTVGIGGVLLLTICYLTRRISEEAIFSGFRGTAHAVGTKINGWFASGTGKVFGFFGFNGENVAQKVKETYPGFTPIQCMGITIFWITPKLKEIWST